MLKKFGYELLLATGMLIGPLATAQGTAQAPATGPQASTSEQPQPGCPRGMMRGDGMRGGMMRPGKGGAGMSCPMAGMVDVKVEETSTGAILRLAAKSPDQVAKVRQHARMMESCMEGGQKEDSRSQKKQ